MSRRHRVLGCTLALILVLTAGGLGPAAAQARPEGEMRWALYVTLSPVWFDPGAAVGSSIHIRGPHHWKR